MIRNKVSMNIKTSEIVVGDIINIIPGMEIPADCIVISSNQLNVDEGLLLESNEISLKAPFSESLTKKENQMKDIGKNLDFSELPTPFLFAGSKVLNGDGKILAVLVGKNTFIHKSNKNLYEKTFSKETPLQLKLKDLGNQLRKIGLQCALIILIVLLMRFIVQRSQDQSWDNDKHWNQFFSYFLVGVIDIFFCTIFNLLQLTIFVVGIPEGLPLAVILTIAYSAKKLVKDNNLVRKLEACEKMARVSVICADKTGTLTKNKLTLTTIWNEKFVRKITDSLFNYHFFF